MFCELTRTGGGGGWDPLKATRPEKGATPIKMGMHNYIVSPPTVFTRELLGSSPIPWYNNMTGPRFLPVRGTVHRAAHLTWFRTHVASTG